MTGHNSRDDDCMHRAGRRTMDRETADALIVARGSIYRPLITVVVLVTVIAAFFLLGLDQWVRPSAIQQVHEATVGLVASHFVLAIIGFLAIYVLFAVACIPVVAFMGVLAGVLFGPYGGPGLAYTGSLLAAITAFLGARFAFRETALRWGGAMARRLGAAMQRDGFMVILFLRFLPIVPFWVVNVVPGILGVQFRPYIVATLIGIVPGAVIYPNVGHGLALLMAAGEDVGTVTMSEPRLVVPLAALAILVMSPVLYRMVRRPKSA